MPTKLFLESQPMGDRTTESPWSYFMTPPSYLILFYDSALLLDAILWLRPLTWCYFMTPPSYLMLFYDSALLLDAILWLRPPTWCYFMTPPSYLTFIKLCWLNTGDKLLLRSISAAPILKCKINLKYINLFTGIGLTIEIISIYIYS